MLGFFKRVTKLSKKITLSIQLPEKIGGTNDFLLTVTQKGRKIGKKIERMRAVNYKFQVCNTGRILSFVLWKDL